MSENKRFDMRTFYNSMFWDIRQYGTHKKYKFLVDISTDEEVQLQIYKSGSNPFITRGLVHTKTHVHSRFIVMTINTEYVRISLWKGANSKAKKTYILADPNGYDPEKISKDIINWIDKGL